MNAKDHSIRTLAHQLWESEGKPEGQAERHWWLAARLISGQKDKAPQQDQDKDKRVDKGGQKRSTDPSEVKGPPEPEQPDQT